MKVNYVILLVALLTIPFCVSEIYTCDDKAIIDKNFALTRSLDADYTGAYNKASSCVTLSTTNTSTACCYIKLKFKNTIYRNITVDKLNIDCSSKFIQLAGISLLLLLL